MILFQFYFFDHQNAISYNSATTSSSQAIAFALPFFHFCITKQAILLDRFWLEIRFLVVSTAPNHIHFLHKTKHLGPSGTLWLRWPILQILSNCFKSFTNPLQNRSFWSLGRLMAQEADPPEPFQMLQILFKFFSK